MTKKLFSVATLLYIRGNLAIPDYLHSLKLWDEYIAYKDEYIAYKDEYIAYKK